MRLAEDQRSVAELGSRLPGGIQEAVVELVAPGWRRLAVSLAAAAELLAESVPASRIHSLTDYLPNAARI